MTLTSSEGTRINPTSPESEQATLKSMLESREALLTGLSLLAPQHFAHAAHSETFSTMQSMFEDGKSIDRISLEAELEAGGRLSSVQGALNRALAIDCDALNIEQYAKVVRDRSIRRDLVSRADAIIKRASSEPNVDALLDTAETNIFTIRDGLGETTDQGASPDDLLAALDDRDGELGGLIPYPYDGMNARLDGYRRTTLTTWAGYTSDGKSIMGMELAKAACQEGKKVGVFNLEMGTRELAERWVSMLTGVNTRTLRSGELDLQTAAKVDDARHEIKGWDIKVYCRSGITPARVRAIQMRERFDVIIFDHLHRLPVDGDWNKYGDFAQQFKNIAMDTNCAVHMLAQVTELPAKPGSKKTPRPVLRQVRGSSGIQHESNFVFFIYADRNEDDTPTGMGEIICAKARDGERGWSVPVEFDADRVSWSELGAVT